MLLPVKSDGQGLKRSLRAKPFCPLRFHITFLPAIGTTGTALDLLTPSSKRRRL